MSANESKTDKLAFVHGHPSYIAADFHYEPHAHPYNELVLVQQGRFRTRVAGQDFVAQRGDVLLYLAGTVHEEWVECNAPVLVWACAFRWNGFQQDEPILRRDSHGHIQELLAQIHLLKKTSGAYICLRILTKIVEELERLKTAKPDSMVEQVRTFIRSRLAHPLTVDDLAEIAGLSQSHFARLYRDNAGRTPMEDVRFLRVEEARRLIMTTQLPLRQIAPMVGLSNEYHLSRLLRTHLGVGVRDLRQSKK